MDNDSEGPDFSKMKTEPRKPIAHNEVNMRLQVDVKARTPAYAGEQVRDANPLDSQIGL